MTPNKIQIKWNLDLNIGFKTIISLMLSKNSHHDACCIWILYFSLRYQVYNWPKMMPGKVYILRTRLIGKGMWILKNKIPQNHHEEITIALQIMHGKYYFSLTKTCVIMINIYQIKKSIKIKFWKRFIPLITFFSLTSYGIICMFTSYM